MINYFKKDFASVYGAIKFLSNDRCPTWVIVIWYILMAPIGFAVLPFVLLWRWWLLRSLNK